jgi:hypothetical protein
MWLALGVAGLSQLYFVRELVAAFSIFALGFTVIAALIGSCYVLQKGWETGLAGVLASQNSWLLAVRRGVSVAEDWARRPIRRAGSELPTNI